MMAASATGAASGAAARHDQHLVLIGGGHTHVQVIKSLPRGSRESNVHITLVDPLLRAWYSGMIPGAVAGLYTAEECTIALGPLCRWAGVRHLQTRCTGIDTRAKEVLLETGVRLKYDVVSFDIGSASRDDSLPGVWRHTITTRPICDLIAKLEATERSLTERYAGKEDDLVRVVVVGGGAAGVELAFCVQARWKKLFPNMQIHLLYGGSTLFPEISASLPRWRVSSALHDRGIRVSANTRVKAVEPSALVVDGESEHRIPYDAVFWATGARTHAVSPVPGTESTYTADAAAAAASDAHSDGTSAGTITAAGAGAAASGDAGDTGATGHPRGDAVHVADASDRPSSPLPSATVTPIARVGAASGTPTPLVGLSALRRDKRGFIRVNRCLQSVNNPYVFACGDCACFEASPLPKAGVYAVRAGEPLTKNLVRVLKGEEPHEWIPQWDFLRLLCLGDGSAIGIKFSVPFGGEYAWLLKDWIDRRFVRWFDVAAGEEGDEVLDGEFAQWTIVPAALGPGHKPPATEGTALSAGAAGASGASGASGDGDSKSDGVPAAVVDDVKVEGLRAGDDVR